jgi:hypothetical protein
VKIDAVRRYALSLPRVHEEPHHHFSSFRIHGKIFATFPPEGELLHVFVDALDRERMIAQDPTAYQELHWGKQVMGLRIKLSSAKTHDVEDLLLAAWLRKAPKALARAIQKK